MDSKNNKQPSSEGESKNPSPLKHKEEVPANADPHIDQDFPGFPHHPSKEKIIKPESNIEHKVAATGKKASPNEKDSPQEELQSEGSANAFERTEGIPEVRNEKKNKDSDPAY